VDPQILRAGFRIAAFVTATAAVLLIFEPRDSAEFVVSAMALGIGLIFVSLVTVLIWYSTPKMPRAHNASVQRRRREQ
jgi:protein-S-isoprenylcysteine O-methyltransferase Ste14